MKKVAICFFGSTGFKQKLGKVETQNSEKLQFEVPLLSIKKNIIEPNKCDVFIHSWSKNNKDELIELLNPINYKFEEHKIFDRDTSSKKNAVTSRFYSEYQANKLKKIHEKKNKFKYDIVIHSRLDVIWFNPLELYEKKNTLFSTYWNSSINENNHGPFNRKNHNQNYALHDWWFYGDSKVMDKFSLIFQNRYKLLMKNNFVYNTHRFTYLRAKELKLNLENIHYRGFDFELYRRFIRGNWTNGINK